jgi:type I site-specific restriction endonuclease
VHRDQHSEAQTRKDLIDPALEKAGWDVHDQAQVGTEIEKRQGFRPIYVL